jgi:hypothetical protein
MNATTTELACVGSIAAAIAMVDWTTNTAAQFVMRVVELMFGVIA